MALLNDYAIVVDAADNVAVVKNAVPAGTETIESVGERMLEYIRQVASGDVLTKAEEVHHREFQVWSGQAISF